MSLTVDVLPLSPLPVVRIAVAGTPAGVLWRVTGRTSRGEWAVAEGQASTGGMVFADPWAPLGLAVTYTLTAGATTETTSPVVRHSPHGAVVTDMSGRDAAALRWMSRGGDPVTYGMRASLLEVAGAALPVGVYAPVAGKGGGSLAAATVAPHSEALRSLLTANRPLILHHNSRFCEVETCDVEPVRTVMVTRATADVQVRAGEQGRDWALDYTHVPRPHAYRAPVATWADVKARWETVAALLADGLTNAELMRGDWLVDQ